MPKSRVTLALVSLAVCVVSYPDVIFGGRTLLPAGRVAGPYAHRSDQRSPLPRVELDPGAPVWEVMAWAHVERRALLAGELPFWDRSNGLGHPLLGNGQTALFYPLHWIPLLNPSWPALWDLSFLLLRFVVALGGCLLLFELGLPLALCAAAAPLGALHGVFMLLSIRADLQAYALMPWVLLALVRLRRAPGPGPAAALGLAVAFCLLAGHPQPSFATLSSCTLIGLCFLFWELPRRAAFLGWSAAGTGTGLLLSAPLWLPMLALLPSSWSLHPEGSAEIRLPAAQALQWLMPTALATGRVRTLFASGPDPYGYLGPAWSVVALCGLLGAVRHRRELAWVWPVVFLALAIYGAPGTGWLAKLPLVSRMSIWVYFQFPALYALALAGLITLGRLDRPWIPVASGGLLLLACWLLPLPKALSAGLSIVAVSACAAFHWRWALAAICLIDLLSFRLPLSKRADPLAPGPFVSWLQEHAQGYRVMGLGTALMPNSAAVFGLEDVRMCEALFPAGVVEALQAVQPKPDWQWFMSADPEEGFDVRSPLLDQLGVRFLVTQGTPPVRFRSSVARALIETKAVQPRMLLIGGRPTAVLLQRYELQPVARVRVPLRDAVLRAELVRDPFLRRSEEPPRVAIDAEGVEVARRDGEGPLRADLAAFAGREVSLRLRITGDVSWADLRWDSEPAENLLPDGVRAVFEDPLQSDLLVLERTSSWPRVFLAEQAAPLLPTPSSDGSLSGLRHAQNEVEFTLTSARSRMAVLTEAWSPGWKATIDGVPAEVLSVPPAFRGVRIAEGSHRIRMFYAPGAWRVAWILFGCGLLSAMGLWSGAARQSRSSPIRG